MNNNTTGYFKTKSHVTYCETWVTIWW